MPRRIERLNEQLKRELAVLIQSGLRDPRVVGVTVTAVRTTADLDLARVLVRLSGTDAEKAEALAGLERAAPWLRREMGRELRIRRVPEFAFQEDVAQERAARIEQLLAEVRPDGGWVEPDDESEGEPEPRSEEPESDR